MPAFQENELFITYSKPFIEQCLTYFENFEKDSDQQVNLPEHVAALMPSIKSENPEQTIELALQLKEKTQEIFDPYFASPENELHITTEDFINLLNRYLEFSEKYPAAFNTLMGRTSSSGETILDILFLKEFFTCFQLMKKENLLNATNIKKIFNVYNHYASSEDNTIGRNLSHLLSALKQAEGSIEIKKFNYLYQLAIRTTVFKKYVQIIQAIKNIEFSDDIDENQTVQNTLIAKLFKESPLTIQELVRLLDNLPVGQAEEVVKHIQLIPKETPIADFFQKNLSDVTNSLEDLESVNANTKQLLIQKISEELPAAVWQLKSILSKVDKDERKEIFLLIHAEADTKPVSKYLGGYPTKTTGYTKKMSEAGAFFKKNKENLQPDETLLNKDTHKVTKNNTSKI